MTTTKQTHASERGSSPAGPEPWPDFPWFGIMADAVKYGTDLMQRSVLFWDVMRQRGNQYIEHVEQGNPPVLDFEHELILDGRDLDPPVNYMLLRILPKPDVRTDPRKRPFIIVDPRAGHGPGIGGFKPESQIGSALRAGHPCYFIGFRPEPEPGQNLERIAQAEARFVETVGKLHPDAVGKPCLIGNCQAGWAVIMLSAVRPELMGPIIVAGSPLSYWAGVRGQNPMRYTGGLLGGTWLTALAGDLGNGQFDGALLVRNFEQLNPANTYWGKSYNLFSKIDTEPPRYLDFEKWWGGFFLLNAEEMQGIADELFVGNKLTSGELVTHDGRRVDLRNIRSPILVFASFGDNITPPQQALGWILDLYDSVDDIRAHEQTIIYNLHHDIGHLGIFVSSKIARKETSEFVENIDLIDLLPPGLYELVIEAKNPDDPDADLIAGDHICRFEARTLDDIRAFGGNSPEDEMRFATAARISEINLGLYKTFLSPFVQSMVNEATADAMRRTSPTRMQYYLLSDLNPFVRPVQWMAEIARQDRRKADEDNPFLQIQKAVSDQIVWSLDMYRDMRDATYEAAFMMTYGSPLLQALVGLRAPGEGAHPPRAMDEAFRALVEKRMAEIKSRIDQGGGTEALFRALAFVRKGEGAADERGFRLLQRIREEYPKAKELSLSQVREIIREQVFLMRLDQERAMAVLPKLVPTAEQRRRIVDLAGRILAASGPLSRDEQARLDEVADRFGLKPEEAARREGKSEKTGSRAD
jgi:Protein of unknown function (DUF3141)